MIRLIFVSLILSMSVTAHSEESKESDNYTFKPVILDGSDGASAVLGLRYGYDNKWIFLEHEPSNSTSDPDTFGAPLDVVDQLTEKNGFVSLKLDGLWTNDEEINPESFSKLNFDIGYEISIKDNIATPENEGKDIDFGLQLSVEGDQNFDNTQNIAALQAGFLIGDAADSYFAGNLAYGEVDASKDDVRKAVTDQETFDRASAELHLQYAFKQKTGRKYSPKSISLNLRHYGEIDAPDTVKMAELDKYQWGVLRLKFEQGIYIAYSEGKLPFDADTSSVLEVGFSHNLF